MHSFENVAPIVMKLSWAVVENISYRLSNCIKLHKSTVRTREGTDTFTSERYIRHWPSPLLSWYRGYIKLDLVGLLECTVDNHVYPDNTHPATKSNWAKRGNEVYPPCDFSPKKNICENELEFTLSLPLGCYPIGCGWDWKSRYRIL